MKSAFQLDQQNKSIDSKLVAALERISETFRVLLWNQGKEVGLSPIQIQVLIFIKFHKAELCKVTYLANEFNLTKPTMSDSIKVLLQKNLLQKIKNQNDSRSFSLQLTSEGKSLLEKISDFTNKIEKPLAVLSPEDKKSMLHGLYELIFQLNQSGIIIVQRMCKLCSNYSFQKKKHYCSLLETTLSEEELRLDCSDFSHSPIL